MRKRWRYTVHLHDIWTADELGFDEQRRRIVRRLRIGQDHGKYLWRLDDGYLAEVLDELEEADNEEAFNYAWDQFYDWADSNRVWVNIHSPRRPATTTAEA